MPRHRESQRQARRRTRRQDRQVTGELLNDVHALRAARERAMVETAPMANMPSDAWERDRWGLSDE